MRRFPLFLASLFLITLMSFTAGPAERTQSKSFTACSSAALHSLELREDHSFTYVNHVNPYHPIEVEGNWKFVEGVIYLEQSIGIKRFPKEWTVNGNGCLMANADGKATIQLCE